MERYKQGDADKYSLFVVGDSRSHFVAFIGNVSSNIKNQITLLKSYTLVTQIGKVEITVENILQALREFNEESDNHLGCFPQVKAYRAKDPSSVQGCFAYGEDPNLYMMKTNQIVKALDLSDVLVRTMDEKFTQRILQACFACMNMGTDKDAKGLGKSQKKIRYSMFTSQW